MGAETTRWERKLASLSQGPGLPGLGTTGTRAVSSESRADRASKAACLPSRCQSRVQLRLLGPPHRPHSTPGMREGGREMGI